MAIYAKVENGVATEYPIFEGQLEPLFTDLKFPLDDPKNITINNGTLCPAGYVVVQVNPVVNPDPTTIYTMGLPTLDPVDGIWKEAWIATPMTADQITAAKTGIALRVRTKRNKLLAASDVYVTSDRWAIMSSTDQQMWATFRQALRDIPTQTDFPISVTWPIEPSVFQVNSF
jgi:hypothetical protein